MNEVYTLPDLPYDEGALEPSISGRIMALHHGKHHATYVTGANKALEQLHDLGGDGDFATMAMIEKDLAFNVSGHVLHSVFWTNLSPDGGGDPPRALKDALVDAFTSVERFREQMAQAAATIHGSGWALASWEPLARKVVVQQVHDHEGNHGQGTVPLLAFDAWEHAYYLQYENRKAEFFDALWNVVNWDDVSRRFDAAGRSELLPV
jgi:Fe-Mn family superoxide dismutase